jgi:hypothetical protein
MEIQEQQPLTKKTARLQLNQALSSLNAIENTLGKKKFRRRMEKIEKILLAGLPKDKKIKKANTVTAA